MVSHEDLGDTDYPYILVEATGQALLDIAKLYRDSFDVKVVGITGSVGKTSTKEMIASVLSQKYNVHKTQGNFNNECGLPLTIFEMNESHEISVLEMGINHFGEMRKLSAAASPDICVITNIGVAHLEFLKTQKGILQENTDVSGYEIRRLHHFKRRRSPSLCLGTGKGGCPSILRNFAGTLPSLCF